MSLSPGKYCGCLYALSHFKRFGILLILARSGLKFLAPTANLNVGSDDEVEDFEEPPRPVTPL